MDIRFSPEDEAFRREVAAWLEAALTGEFAALRGRGGAGDEGAFVEERRAWEKKLRELRAYLGFTCTLEMTFDHGARTYVFDLRTDWYDEFCDLIEDIDAAFPDDDEDTGSFGSGYFSRN